MRDRVEAPRERGIYISVMLFNGWEVQFSNFDGYPFNAENNINGIDGEPDKDGCDTELQTWPLPAGVAYRAHVDSYRPAQSGTALAQVA